MTKSKWVLLGEVGVDSGQLIITDPCYLSGWEDSEYKDKRVFIDQKTKKEYVYAKDFNNFEEIIRDKKTMNQLIKDGEVTEISRGLSRSYSYEGACDTTLNKFGGVIGLGEQGVAFRSGLGDGSYPVYAKIENVKGWGERVTEVKIKFI